MSDSLVSSDTKYCIHCGKKIPADSVVCTKCGRQVELLKISKDDSIITSYKRNNTFAFVGFGFSVISLILYISLGLGTASISISFCGLCTSIYAFRISKEYKNGW